MVTAANFQVIYAAGVRPPVDSGWRIETALDTQMAHALAPKAKIILVEAASNSFAHLLQAERIAANAVAAAGGGEVSNSWGSAEFGSETTSTYTSPFTKPSVVVFASSGDTPQPSYPAVLSNVVAVGGAGAAGIRPACSRARFPGSMPGLARAFMCPDRPTRPR